MTTQIGYPPSGLPSGSSQSAPSLPVAANLFAKGAPLQVNIVTDPVTGLTIGYLAFDGSINYINGNGQVPVVSVAPTISGDNSIGSVLTAAAGTASNSPSGWKWQWMRGEDAIPGANAATYTLTDKDGDSWIWVIGRAYNTQGESAQAASVRRRIRGGKQNDAPQPVITFLANAAQGQWVRENLVQNTVDRGTAGDYYMIGTAANNGAFQVTKRLPDGTYTASVTLSTAEVDDHDVPNLLQLPSGRWMAVWNRHAISGATGFRYALTATAHGMDFGAPVVITGSATWNGGTALSTYNQAYMVGNRVIVFYRVGGSANGAWVCRYSDNIGATTPTWSSEVFVTPTAYMDSCLAVDGVTLRCAMYDHPYTVTSHNMWTFDINLSSGDMLLAGVGTVIGNIFTNVVPVDSPACRAAVIISTGTSRLFSVDEDGNLYGMEMLGGNGTNLDQPGTYYRYVRTAGTGAYTKQSVTGTGLPFLGGQQGYYGSICRLDANRILCSVNTGASIGVGSWELREYLTANGGANWSLASTYQSAAIIMRPQVINDLKYWFEPTVYTTYTSWTSSGKFQRSLTAVYTPRPSRPAGTDPSNTPVALSGSPSAGTAGVAYSWTPTTTGGVGPFTYAITAGSLSGSGLSLNTSTGEVSGATPVEGDYSGVAITVTDTANSQTAALSSLTFSVVANTGFIDAPPATLTKLTDLGGNLYRANSDAATQGGILFTNLKTVPGAATWAVRQGFNHADASGSIGLASSATPTTLLATWERTVQSTVTGLVQTIASAGASAVSTGFTFPSRSPLNIIEVYGSADNIIRVHMSTDGGSTWSTPVAVGTAIATALYVRFSASFSTIGRVIDTPQVKDLVA